GEGENPLPFVDWGCRRVMAVDPIAASLHRLREQAYRRDPDVDARLLLVRADARGLPLLSGTASLVLAIEALCCLNDDHELGLAECARILAPNARLLLSDRAWEGGLFTGLLYGGIPEFLRVGESRSLRDGPAGSPVQTRLFTEEDLVRAVRSAGLRVVETHGLSVMSVVLGYLRGQGRITESESESLPMVLDLLRKLGRTGAARRAHVIVADHGPSPR